MLLLLLLSYVQVGVGGGMKSGVAFWTALRSFKEIHECWAHLEGRPQTEADLPRPISNDYKSIFDLPSTRTAQELAAVIENTSAAPRVTPAGQGSWRKEDVLKAIRGRGDGSNGAVDVIKKSCLQEHSARAEVAAQ